MLHALRWLRKKNVGCVSLLVDRERAAARALYESLGFRIDAQEQDGFRMMLEWQED